MNNRVKNQHYVPQFLLRNFSSRTRKFIWAFDKKERYNLSNRIRERPIKKVASEEFFYDVFKNDGFKTFEDELEKAENTSAPIINKIIKTRSIKDLTIEERRDLSFFVTIQNFRTKGQLLQTEAFMNKMSEQIRDKANIVVPEVDSSIIWFSILEQSKNFYPILFDKVWMLCECDNQFMISDNPVSLQNTINTSEIIGTLGLDSYGIEIYLPISPSLTICLFCEKYFKEKGHKNKVLPNLKCKEENVENLNCLQILNSERFIFSHKNEFGLVKKILSERIIQREL